MLPNPSKKIIKQMQCKLQFVQIMTPWVKWPVAQTGLVHVVREPKVSYWSRQQLAEIQQYSLLLILIRQTNLRRLVMNYGVQQLYGNIV